MPKHKKLCDGPHDWRFAYTEATSHDQMFRCHKCGATDRRPPKAG